MTDPRLILALPFEEFASHLRARLSPETVNECRNLQATFPSPVREQKSGSWLKRTHLVGVNVRTIGTFWDVVKYAFSLPGHIRGIHLLPIWEPGVVGSLYGMASWGLNPEFYSDELRDGWGLFRLEDQLKVCINLLHALDKAVGLDVIPHTDRYSEIVLANPDHFEWLRRADLLITDHRDWLHEEVQGAIYDWLRQRGSATEAYATVGELWALPEAKRLRILFGEPEDFWGRQRRRIDLVDWLYQRGLEPVPATMAPPYRGLEVDPDPAAVTIDAAGRHWRDYRITAPQEMSRVFGPLARYKFYGRHADNRDWQIDFDTPRAWVWDYFTRHWAAQVERYGFDFMRGDMSHVQMRPGGVPATADDYYDPLRAVKLAVGKKRPWFAYFAESFLAEPGYMAYGNELEHLERSEADVTLGNLQSTVPDSEEFWNTLEHYLAVLKTSPVTPAWTVITGDKDDPRFDNFHHWGKMARVFTGLFLGQLPMYYSLGYEWRDQHFTRAANEYYSKLYVFQETKPDKVTKGPWLWGENAAWFAEWDRLHAFAGALLPNLYVGDCSEVRAERRGSELRWSRESTDGSRRYHFVADFSRHADVMAAWPGANREVLFVGSDVLCYVTDV